ncbi:MAG: hypothetical protein ACD_20C00380G0005 [uncultured bacterium]|nr:MAG: hypothetical protein ACD_20C00380G0005 [uncultured bacterium]
MPYQFIGSDKVTNLSPQSFQDDLNSCISTDGNNIPAHAFNVI